MNELTDLVTDNQVAAAFDGTNFGSKPPRDVIKDTLLKIAGGYSTGRTAILCCTELGLLVENGRGLSQRGRRYLYACFSSPIIEAAPGMLEALEDMVRLTGYAKGAARSLNPVSFPAESNVTEIGGEMVVKIDGYFFSLGNFNYEVL